MDQVEMPTELIRQTKKSRRKQLAIEDSDDDGENAAQLKKDVEASLRSRPKMSLKRKSIHSLGSLADTVDDDGESQTIPPSKVSKSSRSSSYARVPSTLAAKEKPAIHALSSKASSRAIESSDDEGVDDKQNKKKNADPTIKYDENMKVIMPTYTKSMNPAAFFSWKREFKMCLSQEIGNYGLAAWQPGQTYLKLAIFVYVCWF